jgi:acyl-CoA thioester hydrolase
MSRVLPTPLCPTPKTAAAPPALAEHRVRIYWEDTDAGGIVFYANYLKYFERARTEWLRGRGIGQQRLKEETGLMFVVAETSVRYLAPARLDDELRITTRVLETARASMTLRQQAWRDAALLAKLDAVAGRVLG